MQALLIYKLGNKNHLKSINDQISHISWGGYDKGGVTTKAFTVYKELKHEKAIAVEFSIFFLNPSYFYIKSKIFRKKIIQYVFISLKYKFHNIS